jgi:hypothetical protein
MVRLRTLTSLGTGVHRSNGVSPPCKRNVLLAFVLYKTEHLRLIGSRPIESVQF